MGVIRMWSTRFNVTIALLIRRWRGTMTMLRRGAVARRWWFVVDAANISRGVIVSAMMFRPVVVPLLRDRAVIMMMMIIVIKALVSVRSVVG